MDAMGSNAKRNWQWQRTQPWWHQLTRWVPSIKLDRAPKRLRVMERLQLGEKRQLLIVSINGRELLIGAAANFLAMLAELDTEHRGTAEQ